MGFCLNKELEGIIDKLTSIDKIGFFFGAGTSMALGIPGITKLTNEVLKNVNCEDKISEIVNQLKVEKIDKGIEEDKVFVTIEDILNKIRTIRELTNDNEAYNYLNISGKEAMELDIEICKYIYKLLSDEQEKIGNNIIIPLKFVSWLNGVKTSKAKEIFTANYDLIFEMAMEQLYIPFFDGFIGANKPFFYQESVESTNQRCSVPPNWIRLWKIHGSLGWFWEKEESGYRIIRTGIDFNEKLENELVIYPSKEKYHASRKQPFISYFDRLKNHLLDAEGLFIISGYSFGDEHINDVIFESLTRNNRMHIMVFLYNNYQLEKISKKAILYHNLSIFSPSEAIIGGKRDKWIFNDKKLKENGFDAYLYKKTLGLGDFKSLVEFLIENSGRRRDIHIEVGEQID